MSPFSRVVGVFFEPGKTFADIAQKPGFLLPMILIMVMSIAVVLLITQHVGWEHMFRQQLETSSRGQQMPPEQREQMIAMQTKFAPIGGIVLIAIGLPIGAVVEAAILLGIVAGILSTPVKFKQIYSILWYASLPLLISSILTIVVIFLKSPDQFNLQNPLAFNPGAFMDPTTTSKFVYSLATSLDLFAFWVIFLVATGIQAAGGKKISFGGALFAVLLPWALWVLGKASLAGLFS